MSNRIITIEREYASGGREVGELVAKQLGIPFYNREILEMASERCGVSVDYLASAEEAAPKSFLYTLMLSSNPTRSIQENLPLSDKVYTIFHTELQILFESFPKNLRFSQQSANFFVNISNYACSACIIASMIDGAYQVKSFRFSKPNSLSVPLSQTKQVMPCALALFT